jgi:hypothetical protein
VEVLIIHDSVFGNTEKVAQAMGDALRPQTEVDVLRVADAKLDRKARCERENSNERQTGPSRSPHLNRPLQSSR